MGIHCHRRLGKQTISRHKKGLDKICEQCLHYQLIKGAGSSNHWDLSRLDRPRRPGACACISCCHPLSPATHISAQAAVLGGWSLLGPAGTFKTSYLAMLMARSCAATPLLSQVLGRGSVFGYRSEPAGLLLGFGWLKLLNGAAPTEGQGNSHNALERTKRNWL